jgi:hypothetical protein
MPPEQPAAEEIPVADGLGFTLGNFAEIIFPCLDAASVGSVVEVGSYKGDFTRDLLEWAEGSGARITAVEPEPPVEMLEVCAAHPELELVRETSHDALARIPLPDAVVLDGDHNYYTLSEELRLIDERAAGELPLMLFHDVCWPHARRDSYYAPERIPEEARQPLAHDAGLTPGEPGVTYPGLPFTWVAAREGGPRNGVLTAIEDFLDGREGLRFAKVPAFFGLGLLWPERAPWSDAVAEIVDPWDDNPLLARLEAQRVAHVVDGIRATEMEPLLRQMLGSRAFTIAERLSKLNQRGEPVFSREDLKRVLGEEDDPG